MKFEIELDIGVGDVLVFNGDDEMRVENVRCDSVQSEEPEVSFSLSRPDGSREQYSGEEMIEVIRMSGQFSHTKCSYLDIVSP